MNIVNREEWQRRAACGEIGPAFLDLSEREQKSICEGCEVRQECLELALRHEQPGDLPHGVIRYSFPIYGGMTYIERHPEELEVYRRLKLSKQRSAMRSKGQWL